MKIGLVRHFKVIKELPTNWVTTDEVMTWFKEYDEAEIEYGTTDLGGIEWKRCYVSDMPRAVKTAKAIYKGEIIQTPALREISVSPLFKGNLKLPVPIWSVLIRSAWLFGHKSQAEGKAAVMRRIKETLDEIMRQPEEDTLVVCHAGLMFFIRRELLRRGFVGPKFKEAQNGKLYVFEN